MIKYPFIIPVVICSICVSSCSSSDESFQDILKDLNASLANVRDKESADKAADQISAMNERITRFMERVSKSGKIEEIKNPNAAEEQARFIGYLTELTAKDFYGSQKLKTAVQILSTY